MKIQVAFQGGGVRFIQMLPIVDALAKARAEDLIEITRVSGSSAGSICAALLALDGNYEHLREWASPENEKAVKKHARLLHRSFDMLFYFRAIRQIARISRGKPIVKHKMFRRFIEDLLHRFVNNKEDLNRNIEILNGRSNFPKLFISATNMDSLEKHLFRTGNLVDAIINSCSFPFLLKNFNAMPEDCYFDCGIVDNLPIEEFKNPHTHGQIILVTTTDDEVMVNQRNQSTGIIDFTASMFSAAINSSVRRSKSLVGHGYLFEEQSDIKIHDLKSAYEKIRDVHWYENTRNKYYYRIRDIVELNREDGESTTIRGMPPAAYFAKSLSKVYKSFSSDDEWSYDRAALIVVADSLSGQPDDVLRRYDRITSLAEITVGDNGISCWKTVLLNEMDSNINSTRWIVTNITDDKHLRVIPMPMMDEAPKKSNRRLHRCLLFFDVADRLELAGKLLRIEAISIQKDVMRPLVQDGSDFIAFTNTQDKPISQAEIVCYSPKRIGAIRVGRHQEKCHELVDPLQFERMDLDRYTAPGNDYHVCGMKALDLPSDQKFGIELKLDAVVD